MAEALAIVGIVSSIIQIVSFGGDVLQRLNEFSTTAKKIPQVFQDIKTTLPLLFETLKRAEENAKADNVSEETRKALFDVIKGCQSQIEDLKKIVDKYLPKEGDSVLRRADKALHSLSQDGKIEQIKARLGFFVLAISNYHITNIPNAVVPPSYEDVKKTFYNVPARRVTDFVSRPAISTMIEDKFRNHSGNGVRTVVLKGMGGQGKTQLAMDFCRHSHGSGMFSTVLWIDTSSEGSLKPSFQEISEIITNHSRKFSNIDERISYVKHSLAGHSSPWLIVFDNYDDPSAFDLRVFMPDGKVTS